MMLHGNSQRNAARLKQQAGRIANDCHTKHLATFGYRLVPLTPSLWTHDTRPLNFSLVVDNFGVKYVGKEQALHLLKALRHLYTVTEGSLFSCLTIKWNYAKKYVVISMPNYIPAMLHKFQHMKPTKHQGAPHMWTTTTYGAKVQYATKEDDSPILSAPKITGIQQRVGTLLYYAVSVHPFMLAALGTIASSQATATQLTEDKCTW
jgi:hypothetical protein